MESLKQCVCGDFRTGVRGALLVEAVVDRVRDEGN